MKQMILLLCTMLVLSFAGCKEEAQISDTSSERGSQAPRVLQVAPEDQNPATLISNLIETPEGLYYEMYHARYERLTNSKGEGNVLFFCPSGENAFYPLCGKPDCKHIDQNCNACIGRSLPCLGYFDHALYSVDLSRMGGEIELIKMNMDGTEHQVVATVDLSSFNNPGYMFRFHHGKLLIYLSANPKLPEEEQKNHLIVLNLSDYSKTEPFAEYLQTAGFPYFEWFFRDKLYGFGSKDKNPSAMEDQLFLEMDAVSGEVANPLSGFVNGFYATDTTWYYFEANPSDFGRTLEGVIPGFREYDLKSGTIKDCGMPVEEIQHAMYDEEFIYARSFAPSTFDKDETVYFLSRDYKLLDQIELKDGLYFGAATSDRILIAARDMGPVYYLEKSDIGSHALELKPIEYLGLPGQN